jgi:hypothetical protein
MRYRRMPAAFVRDERSSLTFAFGRVVRTAGAGFPDIASLAQLGRAMLGLAKVH